MHTRCNPLSLFLGTAYQTVALFQHTSKKNISICFQLSDQVATNLSWRTSSIFLFDLAVEGNHGGVTLNRQGIPLSKWLKGEVWGEGVRKLIMKRAWGMFFENYHINKFETQWVPKMFQKLFLLQKYFIHSTMTSSFYKRQNLFKFSKLPYNSRS